MATAADLLIRVTADVNAAAANLNSLKGDVGALSTSLGQTNADRLRTSLEDARAAGIALAGIGTAIGLAFLSGVRTAADFEKQMSAVKSLLSPTEVQQFGAALEDLAIALGADTGLTVTTKEAAAGIEELIKAGVPAQAVLDGAAKAAIALANATGISVAEAATFAATAMNAFGIKASGLLHVMDVLAGTANATAADMTDLKFGFAAVGPVAHMMGMSIEETSLALGLFANAGLRGQDAGTSLKTMLLNLQPQTKRQTALMKDLGIITADGTNKFFDQTGKVKDLTGIHQVLTDALKGQTDAQAVNTLKQLFGTDAVRAAAIIYSTSTSEINRNRDAILGLSVLDMAKTRVDNMAGAQEVLAGAWEALNIIIFRDFLPGIQSVLLFVANLVSEFSKMDPTLRRVLTAIVGVVGAAAALTGAFILLGPSVISAVQAFGRIAPLLGSILSPILLVVGAVAGLYLAWTKNFLGIRDAITSVVGPIISQIKLVWTAIDYLLKTGDWDTFLLRFQHLTGIDLSGIYNGVRNLVDIVGDLLRGDLLSFISKVQALTGVNLLPVVIAFQEIKNAVAALLTGDLANFNQYVRDLTGIDLSGVTTAISNLVSWVKYLAASGDISTFVARFQEMTGIDLSGFVNLVTNVRDLVSDLLRGDISTFVQRFRDLTGIDLSGVVSLIGRLSSLVSSLTSGNLDTFVAQFWNLTGIDLNPFIVTLGKIGTLIGDVVALDLGNFLVDFRNLTGIDLAPFVAQVSGFVDAVSKLITTGDLTPLVTWFRDLTGIDLGPVVKFASDLASAIGDLVKGDLTTFNSKIRDLTGFNLLPVEIAFGQIRNAVDALIKGDLSTFNGYIKDLTGFDISAVSAAASILASAIGDLIKGDLTTFNSKIRDLTGFNLLPLEIAIGAIRNAVGDLLKGDLTSFNQRIKDLTGFDISPVSNAISTIASAVKDLIAGDLTTFNTQMTNLTGLNFFAIGYNVDLFAKAIGALLAGDYSSFNEHMTTLTGLDFAAIGRAMSDAKTGVEGFVKSVVEFGEWLGKPAGLAFLGFFGTIALAIGGYTLAMAAGTLATSVFTVAVGGAALAMELLLAPVTLIVLAIAALVAGFIYFYNSSPEFKAAVDSVVGTLVSVAKDVVNWVGQAVTKIDAIWKSLTDPTTGQLDLGKTLGFVVDLIGKGLNVSAFTGALDSIWTTASGVFRNIRGAVEDFLYGPQVQIDASGTMGRQGNWLTALVGGWEGLQKVLETIGKLSPFGWLIGLANLIPDWLKPGSPTPLENALTGAAGGIGLIEALRLLGSLNPFGWLLGIGEAGIKILTDIFGGGGGGGGRGGNTYNITIQVAGTNATPSDIVAAIYDAMETFAGEAPEPSMGGGGAW